MIADLESRLTLFMVEDDWSIQFLVQVADNLLKLLPTSLKWTGQASAVLNHHLIVCAVHTILIVKGTCIVLLLNLSLHEILRIWGCGVCDDEGLLPL